MDDFFELSKSRYSCRKFLDKAVPEEIINKLLICALNAPTARNQQPFRIKVLTSKEDIEKAKMCSPCCFNAPLIFLVLICEDECWHSPETGRSSGDIDGAIVETHLMMECADLGLGSTWVLKFSESEARKQFEIPEGYYPLSFLMCGYPAEDAEPSPRHLESKKLEEILF